MNCSVKLAAGRLAAIAGLALASTAFAQPRSALTWQNAAGGNASTSANWSPSQLPGAGDDLLFNLANTYTVTWNNTVPTTRSHVYRAGVVSLNATFPHVVTNGVTVADLSGDNATASLITGAWTSNFPLVIANAAGSTGVVNVNDDDADLIVGGTSDLTVGSGGNGTLNVTGGGLVQVADQLIVGANATSAASLTVSGSVVVSPFWRSTLSVLGTSQSRFGAGGDATVTISSGALATFGGDLVIANGSASTSTATVQTAGLLPALLNVDGNLSIGRNTSAGAAAGVGTLNVNGGGSTTVGGALQVGGDPDGGTGTLHISGTGSVKAHDVAIGAGGTLLHNNGTLTVDGGVFSQATAPLNVSDSAGTPTMILQNGATATLASSGGPAFRGLVVGGPGASADGLLSIRSGAQVTLSPGVSNGAIIGDETDDRGEIEVDGAGSKILSNGASGFLNIGPSGDGRLEVTNGGFVSAANVLTASQATGVATVFVQDPNSILEVTNDLFVGGFSGGAGGVANVFVRDGGLLSVTQTAVSTVVYPSGLISVEDATFNSAGIVSVVGGAVGVNNGAINADELRLDNGQAGGDGVINARVSMSNGSLLTCGASLEPSPSQTLVVGDATTTGGFTCIGSSVIFVRDDSTLTIHDLNTADAEIIQFNSGTISAPNGLRLHSTASVSGHGTFDCDVDFIFGGTITPDATGLRFGGILKRDGGTISGGLIGFNGGGGYTGDGTVACIVDADAGSVITATGILTMGNAASPIGVSMDGTLHCGSGTVTLLDSNGIGLGTLTDLNGATLVCAQNLTVNFGKVIEGSGFVQAPLLTVNGAIKPADLPSLPPKRGTLHVSGAVTLGVNNNYFCDIDPGIEFATADRIQSSGPATINGALTVAFIDGYVPQASHVFDIVVGSTRTGTFTSTSFPPVGPFGPPRVEYLPDRARIIMCFANCDGSVVSPVLTANDFQCFLNKFAAQDPYANCDGSTVIPVLTANDFQCFLNKFAAGCT